MILLLHPAQVTQVTPAGGKAQALASLARIRLPIPEWFVVLPAAFDQSLTAGQRARLAAARSDGEVEAALDDLRPSAEVARQVEAAYTGLCPDGAPVAIRSSAAEEDSATVSFAGQLESYLYVDKEAVLKRIADVWRSGFSDRIIAYRRTAGLDPLPTPPAVIVQQIVAADVSGVAFSCDPVSGRRGVAMVAGAWGLGQALVSGESESDSWRVNRDGTVVERRIAVKKTACRRDPCNPNRTASIPVEEERVLMPTLTDAQAVAVARLARRAERHFGRPQDIEWALVGDTLYLLQSRPVTTLRNRPDPDAPMSIWDNTNIIESYSGVTTPFTFSFVVHAYEQVYRQFCRLMGVPDRVVNGNMDVFRNLLGLLNGRIYYNMVNGYRVLTLLPGYKLNRRFTEEMLGIRETLPGAIAAELDRAAAAATAGDVLRLLRLLISIGLNFLTIEKRITAFHARLAVILPEKPADFSSCSPHELARTYRDLETQLLHRWDAPTVNDFFAAIFHGILRRLCGLWLKDEAGSLHNELLCGDRDMVSMELAGEMHRLSQLAARSPDLLTSLKDGTRAEVEESLATVPELEISYQEYLDRFGDRCLNELKLESMTLRDDPLPLFRAMAGIAEYIACGKAPRRNPEQQIRADAEARARQALARNPLRRGVFAWVLGQTRRRVVCRENLRFERTRAFGMARRIGVEMGRRFTVLGLIERPRDVFYLTVEEMLAVVEGTAVTMDLKELITIRRAEFDRYRAMSPPADRIHTRDIPYIGDQFIAAAAAVEVGGRETLRGIGCCPGTIRGPVAVVENPYDAVIAPGTIIAARRTDPGWVMVFPAAAGLLVERGSMLSHSAIVAREIGLPTIVSIPGLINWLGDGELIEMDGATGVVTRIDTRGTRV